MNTIILFELSVSGATLQQVLAARNLDLTQVTFAPLSDFSSGQVQTINFNTIVLVQLVNSASYEQLGAYQQLINPDSKILCWNDSSHKSMDLCKKLLLSGFVDINELSNDDNGIVIECKVPEYSLGASASLKTKTGVQQQQTKWKISTDEDDEFNNDEQGITKEPVTVPGKGSGCGASSGRGACKNCICGRAEGKGPTKLTKSMVENPQSGCGSCGLGDEFRCEGCPYKGLPKFEMGKKIELPPGFLVADD
eukprot:TRINITY_DN20229_c0_g1_i1.p2 TRINITY_DN20229_c0_g1~~TRINITY_DN20229_c0_g1_i1.p2  ORF type:complete len:271 (+),score=30.78 TRINITY_DN20229_c0_g1_i1:63-815(+)